jgi:hypothetical protein
VSSKAPVPPSSRSSDPALLKVTEAITGTHDAKAADGIADMLLVFLSAAGTILGALLVAMAYVMATASRAHTGSWIFQLLVCVGAGGVLGCLAVMAVLHAKPTRHSRAGLQVVPSLRD